MKSSIPFYNKYFNEIVQVVQLKKSSEIHLFSPLDYRLICYAKFKINVIISAH